MEDPDLEFLADDQSEVQTARTSSQSTDFSSISSIKSQTSSRNNDTPKRSSASVLMMGRSKKKRLQERLESSQSSQDSVAADSIASSSQKGSRQQQRPTPTSTSRSTNKRYRTKAPQKSTLTKIPENESIASGSYRNDHFSVKDAAQSQMLLDECLFLCESIVGQRDPLEPIQSLEEMLSHKENRRQLFFTATGSQSLKEVIDVFAWINRFVASNNETDSESTKFLSASPQVSSDAASTATSHSMSAESLNKRPILDAAKRIAYHVSLDCTLCDEAAHTGKNQQGSSAAARRIRKAVLSNPECMQGLFHLVLDDVLTDQLRDSGVSQGSTPLTGKDILLGEVSFDDSQSLRGKMDPTIQGRLKRKQLKLTRSGGSSTGSSPEVKSETLSFASSGPSAKRSLLFSSKTWPKGKEATSGDPQNLRRSQHKGKDPIDSQVSGQHGKHTCRDDGNDATLASTASLLAVKRIISAKHEDSEKSAIDDDEGCGGGDDADFSEDYNPIVATNQLLSSSGALPLLSRALSNSLVACIAQTRFRSGGCEACAKYLGNRVCSLASIADAASLFNVNNRIDICNEGFTSETNGYLVVGMLSFLEAFLGIGKRRSQEMGGVWEEVALSILKTLTSLSHENDVVANELKTKIVCPQVKQPSATTTGLEVLVEFLGECVTNRLGNDREDKILYDCQIYCLSILANIATNRGCVEVLSTLAIQETEGLAKANFLEWLTRWLVSLTKTFHNAIMESSFGTSGSIHDDRILTQAEEEGLVASGKGFIFLSRVLVHNCGNEVTHLIFTELPGETPFEKMKMIKNTLKAFMSFYRQSVGGLSMAIFAPLQALLKKLDTIESSLLA